MPAQPATGSWWSLVSVYRQSAMEFDAYRSMVPMACPVDGEPLTSAPGSSSRSGTDRFCRYDGFSYPRDHVVPMRP